MTKSLELISRFQDERRDAMVADIPNPGSPEAEEAGCTCPIMDNNYGKGYFMQPNVFVMNFECPIHGGEAKRIIEDSKECHEAM